MDGSPEIMAQLQQILIPVILITLQHSIIGKIFLHYMRLDVLNRLDVLDHALDLVDSLTFNLKTISPDMWPIFEQMYKLFKGNVIDFLEGR